MVSSCCQRNHIFWLQDTENKLELSRQLPLLQVMFIVLEDAIQAFVREKSPNGLTQLWILCAVSDIEGRICSMVQ